MKKKRAILVSAYGRGHLMAAELAQAQDWDVVLYDVSAQLGVFNPQDTEGPFGFFLTDKLTPNEHERLFAEHSVQNMKNGFTLWLSSGPFELKGPLTQHRFEALGLLPENKEALLQLSLELGSRALDPFPSLLDGPVKQRWLAMLACDWASLHYVTPTAVCRELHPLPLFNSFHVRFPTRQGLDQLFTWCREKGVQVLSADVLDAAVQDQNFQGLEIKSGKTELVKGDFFIWGLSSQETMKLSPSIYKKLFVMESPIVPLFSWVRFGLRLADCKEREVLPLEVLILTNLENSWTHENYMILKRSQRSDDFDLWLRIPTDQRFHQHYLKEVGQRALALLDGRCPPLAPMITEFPVEYHNTFAEVGPSRFMQFAKQDLKKLKTKKIRNVLFDGPEYWQKQTVNGAFPHQRELLEQIKTWAKARAIQEKRNYQQDNEAEM